MNGYQGRDAAQAAIVAARMDEALRLAADAIGLSDPNPRVGCVITDADNRVIGRGHTQQAGGPHAEVMALREARARGEPLAGATAYVTLEPCSHFGRTPPCCNALIEAGVARVVVALRDPNPLVAGSGTARLVAAGIEVIELPEDGPHALRARRLNVGFLFRMQHGRPWVRLLAMTADAAGPSWPWSDEQQRDLDIWRRRAGALLGDGAAPRAVHLQARDGAQPRVVPPLRVRIDAALETAPAARLPDGGVPARIYCAGGESSIPERGGAELRRRADAHGGVDLRAVLEELGGEGINELQVEAGDALADALFAEGLVDELLIYGPHQGEGEANRLWAATFSGRRADFDPLESARLGPVLRLAAIRRAS